MLFKNLEYPYVNTNSQYLETDSDEGHIQELDRYIS